ncbi:MAG TPA: hypothetical protein VNV88_03800 [Candidatus Solibacter sp.]|nr:hypothetical protein [Candidatus Solibacter sp.]
MWKYLKAAFLVGVDVPAVGRLPVNLLAAAGFTILGFAQPAFWLLGLGLETSVVFALGFNPRFQKYVDGQQMQLSALDVDAQRQALVRLLAPSARDKLSALAGRCQSVLQVYQGTQADEFIINTNQDSLQRLQWLYLKLLVGRHYLEAGTSSTGDSLRQKIEALEKELQAPAASEQLRQSKTATLSILKQRLNNFQNRTRLLEEIDSDLTRIEAQVDLALENASIQGRPQTISTEIELASDLASGTLFGDSQGTIAALEHSFASSANSSAQRQVN